jgi:hypothetical protein
MANTKVQPTYSRMPITGLSNLINVLTVSDIKLKLYTSGETLILVTQGESFLCYTVELRPNQSSDSVMEKNKSKGQRKNQRKQ